jgi:hypothetical protein
MKSPQFMTEKEVSEITRISASKLQSDRHKGKGLPYHKIGNRTVRYALEDVRAFMDGCRIQTN